MSFRSALQEVSAFRGKKKKDLQRQLTLSYSWSCFFFLFSFHSCKGIQLFRFQTWSLPGRNLNLGVRIPCQTCLSGDLSGGCSTGYYRRVAPGSPSVSISQVMAFYRPGSHQDLTVALEQPSFSRNSSTLFSPKSSKSVRTEKLISKGPFSFLF